MVPVVFTWTEVALPDGELRRVMIPVSRYIKVAARQFHEGEEYPLVVLEARSRASHNQYFAALGEAFKNLPENIQARWPSVEHFRKWCLIETGWYFEKEVDFGSSVYAKRAAILLHDEFDDYARIYQPGNGSKLIVRRAKSQSAQSMGKEPFEASKKDVLDLAAGLIGVKPAELKKHAGRSG